MNTLTTITKIELKKLFKRKDSWFMFTILLVPILYSVGLAVNSDVITYTGAGNITAIGFANAMFQMSQSMFIFNVILKTLVCVGTYMILYIIMNLMSYMDGIKYLSPLHYIVAVSSNTLQFTFSTMIFSLYTICMGILFTHIGIRRIEKMDL